MISALVELVGTLLLLRLSGWLLVAEPFVTVTDPHLTQVVRQQAESADRALVAGMRVLGWFLLWSSLAGVTVAVLRVVERV